MARRRRASVRKGSVVVREERPCEPRATREERDAPMAGRSDSRSAVLLDLDETMLQSDRGFHRAARDTAQALCRDSPAVDAEVLRDTLIAAIDRVWQAKTID